LPASDGHVKRSPHLEETALMVEYVPPGRIEEAPLCLVAQKSVVLPTVPQASHDLGEFDGALVALRMIEVRVAVEVLRLMLVRRRHQIPSGAPAANVIERRELAGDMVRLVETGRRRGHQTHVVRDGCQRRQQGNGFELRHVAVRRAAEKVHVVAPRAGAVGEKQQIELRGLRSLGKPDVMSEVDAGIGLRLGMAPCGNVMPGRVEKGAEAQMASAFGHGDGRWK
jgi:hypothetical protein